MRRLFPAIVLLLFTLAAQAAERGFTLLAYNVENLFDVDGVAEYGDYRPDAGYGPRHLLTKVQNITKVLQRFNHGAGPEIVVFNEFEVDRTPSPGYALRPALQRHDNLTVEEMLGEAFNDEIADLPAEFFLLKHLEDSGLKGYKVVQPEITAQNLDQKKPQKNVVFTRFPVAYSAAHPTQNARDILEVGLSVEGRLFVLFANHWKSGASNPQTEDDRRANAKTLRRRLDTLLGRNPALDIILAGDFNSHYNQSAAVRGIGTSGLNDILGSAGDELAAARSEGLYNLWFELPPEKRGSETYRGRWGTLMQIILAPGLYDAEGIRYVDNSFFVASFPGLNTLDSFGRPYRWHMGGEGGGGFSDHFPVGARFKVAGPGENLERLPLVDPSRVMDPPRGTRPVDFASVDLEKAPSAATLADLESAELAERFGKLYHFKGKLASANPPHVEVGPHRLKVYAYDKSLMKPFEGLRAGDAVDFHGELFEYRGELEFVLQDESWTARMPGN